MDYIQKKILKSIDKAKKRKEVKYETVVGYYNVLMQYRLYVIFACIWSKRECELSRVKRSEYLKAMRKASLGKVCDVILSLENSGNKILGIDNNFREVVGRFTALRNADEAHGILVPGIQKIEYKKIADENEKIEREWHRLNLPILNEECKLYYIYNARINQAMVYSLDDFDYEDISKDLIKTIDMQPYELYYNCGLEFYKISPFLYVKESEDGENPYEIYCYQSYNLKNGIFEYKRYSSIENNISYSQQFKDYLLQQEESDHTIIKANGVICNRYENNYDYFISTSPIDTHVQKVWSFIVNNKSNTCLTVRGGGGIGKTALVQYVCTKKIFEDINFDISNLKYVIFCSAKDREYKQVSGLAAHIRSIRQESTITNYRDIIKIISWILEINCNVDDDDDVKNVENEYINTSGVLTIIDDFETLGNEDKNAVINLISRMDISRHKVIITTRSQYMVGEEYYISGLEQNQIIDFMKARYKTGYDDCTLKGFEKFILNKDVKKQLYVKTKGLPMLAIQLGTLLDFSNFNISVLNNSDDEELDDFLLGRLYDYFNTITSKLLFYIIIMFQKFTGNDIVLNDIEIIYSLLCHRNKIPQVDFYADLKEVSKLNVIKLESDYVHVSNMISNKIIIKCQDNLNCERLLLLDSNLFKIICSKGIKSGIKAYVNQNKSIVDESFLKIFVYDNMLMYSNEDRFDILDKYISHIANDYCAVGEVYLEASKFFDISLVDEYFFNYGKRYGFTLDNLSYRRDIGSDDTVVYVEYLIEEMNKELEDDIDLIDEYLDSIRQKKGNSYRAELRQNIRGKIVSMCNVKLHDLLENHYMSLIDESNNIVREKISKLKMTIDQICITKEFNIKENPEYKKLSEILQC